MTLDPPSIGGTKRAVPVFLARCGQIVLQTPRPAGGLPQIDLCPGCTGRAVCGTRFRRMPNREVLTPHFGQRPAVPGTAGFFVLTRPAARL